MRMDRGWVQSCQWMKGRPGLHLKGSVHPVTTHSHPPQTRVSSGLALVEAPSIRFHTHLHPPPPHCAQGWPGGTWQGPFDLQPQLSGFGQWREPPQERGWPEPVELGYLFLPSQRVTKDWLIPQPKVTLQSGGPVLHTSPSNSFLFHNCSLPACQAYTLGNRAPLALASGEPHVPCPSPVK